LKYVSTFKDRHGVARLRFRRGPVSIYLTGPIGSEAFVAEYAACMTNAEAAKRAFKAEPLSAPDRPLVTQAREYLRQHSLNSSGEYVYFVWSERRRVKIGFTGNALARFGSITTNCPERLRLLALVPGSKADERSLHERFASSRIIGEWFRSSVVLKAAIRQIKMATLATPNFGLDKSEEKAA
jgi:hypothetical protein